MPRGYAFSVARRYGILEAFDLDENYRLLCQGHMDCCPLAGLIDHLNVAGCILTILLTILMQIYHPALKESNIPYFSNAKPKFKSNIRVNFCYFLISQNLSFFQ